MVPRGRKPPTHVDDPVALGQRLRQMRQASGLSLRGLAFEDCSAAYLSRIENGTRVPSPAILQQLAERLNTTVESLTGRPPGGVVPAARLIELEIAVGIGSDETEDMAESIIKQARELGDRVGQSKALESLGQLALDQRDDERAVSFLEEAVAVAGAPPPRARPSLYESLGRAHAGLGDVSKAIAVLRPAFEDALSDPVDPALALRFGVFLASAHTDLGEPAEALATLSRLLEHEAAITDRRSLARLEWALSRTYAEAGRSEIAERYARRVIGYFETSEESTRLGRAHLVLGAILLDRDRASEADSHLLRARSLMNDAPSPEVALLSYEQARQAMIEGNLERCEQLAREALDETEGTEPGTAGMAYTLLAKVAAKRGDLETALFIIHQALENLSGTTAAPYCADAYETLAEIAVDLGRTEEALEALRKANALRRRLTSAHSSAR
jgi:tetratricopeptide (TPR) repeat protein